MNTRELKIKKHIFLFGREDKNQPSYIFLQMVTSNCTVHFNPEYHPLKVKFLPASKYSEIDPKEALGTLKFSSPNISLDTIQKNAINDGIIDKKITAMAIALFFGHRDTSSILSCVPKEIVSYIVRRRFDIARNQIELFFDRLKSGNVITGSTKTSLRSIIFNGSANFGSDRPY